ncbi:MAG: Sec-independent protein translocase, TatC subunit, partial [Anaeromyxobacteraceae bacterium]|nr:Sec-independent protein translocase, TatC subunit [Anaeromyxobacteraceae bacterium]MBS1111694.1 Sec-independent protein translocase, TatC subunit [Anaeromyxobacteraceae bacterium]
MSDPAENAPAEGSEPPPPEGEVRASFFDHLTELRIRLVRALLGIAVGVAVVGWFSERLFRYVMQPVLDALPEGQRALNYTSSLEPFLVYLKVSLYGGLFLAAPWVL